jgi:5-methylcytosine-specific restriction endonuclease McrA
MLEARELHLSALVMLSPHLTEENHEGLLSLARGKSERWLERALAGRFPRETRPKDFVRWLDEQTALLGIVLPADVLAMLERVVELRKHVHPDESVGDNLRDVLVDYLDRNDPLRKASPRERKPKMAYVHRRQIRRRIQVEVWKRDGGQCTFTSPSGHRCGEQAGLQIDHRQAWADGGSSRDASNLRLLCGPHNRYLAERRFGERP